MPRSLAVACTLLAGPFLAGSSVAQEFLAVPVYEAIGTTRKVARPVLQAGPPPLVRTAAEHQDPLDRLVDQAITVTGRRMLVVVDAPGTQPNENTPWQIAHGILALRRDYQIVVNRRRVNALQYVASGPRHTDKPWFLKTEHGGKGHPFTEKWQFEGHPNQFLAFFATAGIPTDFALVGETPTGRRESFTLGDWIKNAQAEINAKEEITWTLWAFSTYLPPNSRWVDQYNRGWSMEKLIRMQMEKHPTESACGGMHGLFAIANALNAKRGRGEQLRGVWLEADQHVKKFVAEIRSMQNTDGSFSSNYLKGPEHERRDVDKRISTTGHTLEFLMNALPASELRSQWVRAAVERTARDLAGNSNRQLEPGGLYHACNALVIYRERTRPEQFRPATEPPRVAEEPERVKPASREEPRVLQPVPAGNDRLIPVPATRPTGSEDSIHPAHPAFELPFPAPRSSESAPPESVRIS